VTGNSAFAGLMTIVGDMLVAGTGKITVGDMVIDPSSGGSVRFPGGAAVRADTGGGVRAVVGTNKLYVGPGAVTVQGPNGRNIILSASGISILGLDTRVSSLANGAVAGTIWSDGTQIFRVVDG